MDVVPPEPGLRPLDHPEAHQGQRFEPGIDPEVDSDWGDRGEFILVKALVNGRDVGWFIFDTGASGCVITPEGARGAGLVGVGRTAMADGRETTVYRSAELRVGPLTLSGLNMTGLHLGNARSAFGRPVAGILGRNVCTPGIVEIDGPARTLRLLGPGADDVPADAWMPLDTADGLARVRCGYAGENDGPFLIDTGANAGVHFFGSTVERRGLADAPGVRMTGSATQITFGSVDGLKVGTVDDFRVGALQCGPVDATFVLGADPVSHAVTGADGLIGMGLLRRQRMYLDESGGRVALRGPVAR
jgi:hypothetical protein